MSPVVVAPLPALLGWSRIARVTLQPLLDHVVIELFRPQHAGKALAHYTLCIRRQALRNHGRVELVRFPLAQCERPIEALKRTLSLEVGIGKTHPDDYRLAGTDRETVMSRRFGAGMLRINSTLTPVHHVVVNAVLHVRVLSLHSKESPVIGFVLGEKQFRRAFAMEPAVAGQSMVQFDDGVRSRAYLVQLLPPFATSPRPCVPEPNRRQKPKISGHRSTIRDRDLDQNVLGVSLGVFHEYIEIAVVVEHTRIHQSVLRVISFPAPASFHLLRVRELRLRILV